MKRTVRIHPGDLIRVFRDGAIHQIVQANRDLITLTQNASKKNPVEVGKWFVSKKQDLVENDIGIVIVGTCLCLEEICALRDEIKSLKKMLKKQSKKEA